MITTIEYSQTTKQTLARVKVETVEGESPEEALAKAGKLMGEANSYAQTMTMSNLN
jgi:hypothetical protein